MVAKHATEHTAAAERTVLLAERHLLVSLQALELHSPAGASTQPGGREAKEWGGEGVILGREEDCAVRNLEGIGE